jgi:ABC-type glutathione transport system ATPase component
MFYTPSASVQPDPVQQALDQDAVLHEIGHLGDLRLTSPPTPTVSSSAGRARTPSIRVTPSAATTGSRQAETQRTDSLADLISGIRLETPRSGSGGAAGPRESRSPSPSLPHKASYQIEREDEQAELSEIRVVQDAIANAKTLTARIIDALSSSNLHREHGSRIHSLHQQATELHGFQLPSSRIVGLVGDSGAGKSKLFEGALINVSSLGLASFFGSIISHVRSYQQ